MKCEKCGYDDHGTGSAHHCYGIKLEYIGDVISENSWELYNVPTPVGYWCIGQTEQGTYGLQFSVYSMPTPEQIKNTEETFGWKWKDHK